jgi:nucleoside-diphosphate-sugar epimerase
LTLSTDLEVVVRDAVEGTLNALRAAASTPSIKRVVITSSVGAVGLSAGDRKLGKNDFTIESIEMAKALPIDHLHKSSMVYVSSKTQAEQAAWKFVREVNVSALPSSPRNHETQVAYYSIASIHSAFLRHKHGILLAMVHLLKV